MATDTERREQQERDRQEANRYSDEQRKRLGYSPTAGELDRLDQQERALRDQQQREIDAKNQAIDQINAENQRQGEADDVREQGQEQLRRENLDRERQKVDDIGLEGAAAAPETRRREQENARLLDIERQKVDDAGLQGAAEAPAARERERAAARKEEKPSPEIKKALERGNSRTAAFPNRNLTPAEQRERADKAGLPGDIIKEVLSLGQSDTESFNRETFAKEYRATRGELGKQYDQAKVDAEKDGKVLTESKDQYLDRATGTLEDYTKKRLAQEPSLERLALNYVPVVGTGLSIKDTKAAWSTLTQDQKVQRVVLDGLSAVGDVVLVGGAIKVGITSLKGGTTISRLTVPEGQAAGRILTTAADAGRPIRSVVVAATSSDGELREVARLGQSIGNSDKVRRTLKDITIEAAPTEQGIKAAIATDDALTDALPKGKGPRTNLTIVIDRVGADPKAIANALKDSGARRVTLRIVKNDADAGHVNAIATKLSNEITDSPASLRKAAEKFRKAATLASDPERKASLLRSAEDFEQRANVTKSQSLKAPRLQPTSTVNVTTYGRRLENALTSINVGIKRPRMRSAVRVAVDQQTISPTRKIKPGKIRTELGLEPDPPRAGVRQAVPVGPIEDLPEPKGALARELRMSGKEIPGKGSKGRSGPSVSTRGGTTEKGGILVAYTPGRVVIQGNPRKGIQAPDPGRTARPGTTTAPTPGGKPNPTRPRPTEFPRPETVTKQKPDNKPDDDTGKKVDNKPGLSTDPKISENVQTDTDPGTRPETQPKTQTAPKLKTRLQSKLGVTTKTTTTRAFLPRHGGGEAPAGQFVRKIELKQGFTVLTKDLVTGKITPSRADKPGSPYGTIRPVEYGREKPKELQGRIGAFNYALDKQGRSIVYERNRVGKPKRMGRNPFRARKMR